MKTGTARTKVKRGSKRDQSDPQIVRDLLDQSFLCHIGFVINGEARVLPTAYVRMGDALYVHGNPQNGMYQAMCNGQIVCVTVTILDGMVLARSAFHHSVNYRSVVVFGHAEKIEGEEKLQSLDALIEHFSPDRLSSLRPYSDKELAATLVVKLRIEEASAKIRTGPPVDTESDYELPIWAGVLPLKMMAGEVESCPRLLDGVAVPEHVLEMKNKM